MSADDYGWPGAMVLDLTDGMPTRPRRAMSALDTLRVTLNSIPRHAMGGKRARALAAHQAAAAARETAVAALIAALEKELDR